MESMRGKATALTRGRKQQTVLPFSVHAGDWRMSRGLAMVKNILGKSENSTLGVIMVTTTEGQSWNVRGKLLEWRSGANPSGLRSNVYIKLHELFI